jgi:hypothetical protein
MRIASSKPLSNGMNQTNDPKHRVQEAEFESSVSPFDPIAHAVHIKESYENKRHLEEHTQYDKCFWYKCGDFRRSHFCLV